MSDPTQQTAPPTMSDFINMSALLTGIAADVLLPSFPVNQVHEQILAAAFAQDPTALANLIAKYKQDTALGLPPNVIINDLMGMGTAESLLSKSIILAWYTGSWYDTASLYTYGNSKVLSAEAYENGYMWKVAQAHAMGSADYPFGYWTDPPPALSDFITSGN